MADAMKPFMPTVDLADDALFDVGNGEIVTWAEIKRRASPPAREEAPAEGAGDKRTIDGETVLGFKVAAWRYQNASDADGAPYGYRYCEHWSTPGNGAKAVERLFTETQLRDALRARTSEPEA